MKIAWDDNPNVNGSILVKRQVHQFLARGNESLIQLYIVGVSMIEPEYAKDTVVDNDAVSSPWPLA